MDWIYVLEVLLNRNNDDFFEEVSRISYALDRNNLFLDVAYDGGGLNRVLFDEHSFNFDEISGIRLLTVFEGVTAEDLRRNLVTIVLDQIEKLNKEGVLK